MARDPKLIWVFDIKDAWKSRRFLSNSIKLYGYEILGKSLSRNLAHIHFCYVNMTEKSEMTDFSLPDNIYVTKVKHKMIFLFYAKEMFFSNDRHNF